MYLNYECLHLVSLQRFAVFRNQMLDNNVLHIEVVCLEGYFPVFEFYEWRSAPSLKIVPL